jgi:PadR family transcriptional regulator, regulatory protein AphA
MSPMVRRPPGLELALLGFLRQSPKHGYQIHQMFSEPAGLGMVWQIKQSQLYALLTKLEADGYVNSIMQNQEPHPPRRVFRLTNHGRKAYLHWLTCAVPVPRLVRQEFLAKVYFLQNEDKASTGLLIERQMNICQRWLDDFHRQLAQYEPGSFGWITFQYRINHIEGMLNWLEVCKRDLK